MISIKRAAISGAAILGLAGGAGAVVSVVTPVAIELAAAHTGTLAVTATCAGDHYLLAYTGSTTAVPDGGPGHVATITVGEQSAHDAANAALTETVDASSVPASITGNTAYGFSSTVPGTATYAQATAFLTWGDNAKSDPQGTIVLAGTCAPPPPKQIVVCRDGQTITINEGDRKDGDIDGACVPPPVLINVCRDGQVINIDASTRLDSDTDAPCPEVTTTTAPPETTTTVAPPAPFHEIKDSCTEFNVDLSNYVNPSTLQILLNHTSLSPLVGDINGNRTTRRADYGNYTNYQVIVTTDGVVLFDSGTVDLPVCPPPTTEAPPTTVQAPPTTVADTTPPVTDAPPTTVADTTPPVPSDVCVIADVDTGLGTKADGTPCGPALDCAALTSATDLTTWVNYTLTGGVGSGCLHTPIKVCTYEQQPVFASDGSTVIDCVIPPKCDFDQTTGQGTYADGKLCGPARILPPTVPAAPICVDNPNTPANDCAALPSTGDNVGIILFVALVITVLGLLALIARRRRPVLANLEAFDDES